MSLKVTVLVPALRSKEKALEPSVTVPVVMVEPATVPPLLVVSNTEFPTSITAPNCIGAPLVRTVPLIVVVLAVEVNPPAKARISAVASPSVTPPVFKNETALVMVAPPLRTTE